MPPADPLLWQILERFKTNLEAIVAGTDYFITPSQVLIVRTFEDARLYNSSAGDPATIYGIRRFDVVTTRHASGDATSGDRIQSVADIGVLLARWHNPSSQADDPTEAELLERMRADVVRALTFVDPGMGAAVKADDVLDEGGLQDSVVEDVPDGWIACGLTFRVTWQYFSSRP